MSRRQSCAAPVPMSREVADRRQWLMAVLASLLAWSFNLFDLLILLFLAPTIAPLFFPAAEETLSLAGVYGSFAVTLAMRPVGSALFGSYADRRGRKRAMQLTVWGVGITTALMGTVPTYQHIGVAGTACFLVLRLAQGVFVGGVVASTHTIGTETIGPRWRGLMSGLIAGSAGVAAVLASVVHSLVSSLISDGDFTRWGWRIVFLSGLVGSAVSLAVLRHVDESPVWACLSRRERQPAPVRTVLSKAWRGTLASNILVVAGGGTQYYLASGYLPTFLTKVTGLAPPTASRILIMSNTAVVVACAGFGELSERVGRRRALVAAGIINGLALPALYLQLARLRPGDGTGMITVYAVALGVMAAAGYAPALAFLNERFPTGIRASGTALSWNLGFAIGGMTPALVSFATPSLAAIHGRLAVFLVAGASMSIIGVAFSRPADVERPKPLRRRAGSLSLHAAQPAAEDADISGPSRQAAPR